jgi:Carboxypeptidase regulatory-like domain/TonB dependent receptor-like, beta-barrel
MDMATLGFEVTRKKGGYPMFRSVLHLFFYLTLLCLTLSSSALAQTDRGTIEGFVTDPSGAAVPNAEVQIVQTETNTTIEITTNEAGRYFVANLPLGVYRVVVQQSGFRTARREPILIQAQTRARVDITLEVGAMNETTQVSGEAPLLDASSATLTTGLTTRFIEELPLITVGRKRDITQFLRYLPGVTRDSTWGARVNGANPGNSEVFIDGAPGSMGNVRGGIQENGPAVEQVGEFSVVTNAFNAEYGRTGSWFTNITIRSGTNDLHGSVFDYFANDALNARSFFQNQRTVVRQNEGGFTLGGPVYLPKQIFGPLGYDGRNRTFLFVGQNLFWNRQAAQGNLLTIPRADFRRGDFSNLRDASGAVIPIFDPATTRPDGRGGFVRDQFSDNIIPASRISPISRRMIELMPPPDSPQLQSENWFNRTGVAPKFDTWVTTVKFDHSISQKQKFTVTYSDQSRPRLIAGRGWGFDTPLEGFQNQHIDTRTGRFNHDYVFGPNLLNHFTFGFDRYRNPAVTDTIGQGWNERLGIRGLPWDAGAFPFVSFAGGTAPPIDLSGAPNSLTANGRVTFNNNLTWVRGQHSLKFGGAYYREYQNSFEARDGSGNFQFSNATTSQPNAGANFTRWGHAFASFLLGEVHQTQTRSPFIRGTRFRYGGLFAQDEWRVRQRLTLSYGLRWDFTPAAFDVNDRATSFDSDTPNPGAGGRPGALVFAGEGPGRIGRRRIADNWYWGFGPRLGLAYELNRKTVLRASAGIYYAPSLQPRLPADGFQALPVFTSPDSFTPVYNWGNIFPQDFPRPPFIDPAFQNQQNIDWVGRDNARPPQILTWTFSIQRELVSNLALDVSYIGHHSTHLVAQSPLSRRNVVDPRFLSLGSLLTQRINSPAAVAAGIRSPFPGFENYRTNTVAQALKPYPQYNDINKVNDPIGISRFNSLQVKLTKRLSNGLTLLAFWTWQKNMTNVEGGPIDLGPGDGAIQNPLDRVGEVSVSNEGAPHAFVASFSYELPFGPGKRFLQDGGLIRHVVGGWQIVGYVRRASGNALSLTTGNNLGALGYPNKRANLVLGEPIYRTSDPREFDPARDFYLNPSAFAIPGSFELGTTARVLDWVRGWTNKSEAVSFGKRTKITERVGTLFRMDMENPFNFVRWSNPITNRSDSNFGRVTSMEPGRQIQLSLAIEF